MSARSDRPRRMNGSNRSIGIGMMTVLVRSDDEISFIAVSYTHLTLPTSDLV